MSVKKG